MTAKNSTPLTSGSGRLRAELEQALALAKEHNFEAVDGRADGAFSSQRDPYRQDTPCRTS